MIDLINFQKKIFAFAVMLIVISSSGCVAELNSQNLNHGVSSDDIKIISSIDDLQKVIESDASGSFNPIFVETLNQIENHDYAYEKEMASDTADFISSEMYKYGLKPLNASLLEDYGNYTSEMERVNRIIDTLNENMDLEFEPVPFDDLSHSRFIKLINKGEKYLPVVDSYNELLYSSNLVLVDKTNDEYIKRFYICAFLLSVDIALIQSGGVHKNVFKSVRTLNTELKLMKSVPYLGYSGYGLLLSTIYWSIKGYVVGFKNEVFDVLRDGIPDDYLINIPDEIMIEDVKKQLESIDVEKSKKDLDSLSSNVATWLK